MHLRDVLTLTLLLFKLQVLAQLVNVTDPDTVLRNMYPLRVFPYNAADDFPRAKRKSQDATEANSIINVARKVLGVRRLMWDNTLQEHAQRRANELSLYGLTQPRREGPVTSKEGENIAVSRPPEGVGPMTMGTLAWLSQSKNYKGLLIPEGDFENYSQYTQCVWKGSNKWAIAASYNTEKQYWVTVARFWPGGNVLGEVPYNEFNTRRVLSWTDEEIMRMCLERPGVKNINCPIAGRPESN